MVSSTRCTPLLLQAEHQLTEKLIFFWHGHWATSVQKVKSAAADAGPAADLARSTGAATSRALVQAMLRDPALIFWLDGQQNTGKAPNENLARELMELFTLGIGAYTEDDVKAAARALTGWTVDRATGTATLEPAGTTTRPKTILGQTGELRRRLVRRPAARPAGRTPTFLARRLWFRFASGDPIPDAAAARWSRRTGRPRRDRAAAGAVPRRGVRRHAGPAGQAAGRVAGRRAAPARHRPGDAARPTSASSCSAGWTGSARCRCGRRASAAGRPARPG